MSDGREEREEREARIQLERQTNREDLVTKTWMNGNRSVMTRRTVAIRTCRSRCGPHFGRRRRVPVT
jgi:hypothetical protein